MSRPRLFTIDLREPRWHGHDDCEEPESCAGCLRNAFDYIASRAELLADTYDRLLLAYHSLININARHRKQIAWMSQHWKPKSPGQSASPPTERTA